ncbi:MAG TPA: penicillin acylase family protein [Dermatophilaceae bacterium]|nr:penicillin acylase family protein [Dermatophilaceae bacterium]
MPRRHVVRRVLLGVAALVVVLLVVGTVLAVTTVRRSFPQTQGELSLPGLTSRVSVVRDAQGVPHITADNSDDLFKAQGFVAAQDRFFQMDLRRHVAAGRLSELVGSSAVATDTVVRTLGWRQVAEQELPTLSSATRTYLQAYADGVNAYIDQAGSAPAMALEYAVLGRQLPLAEVEPWTPLDSLTWLKAIAWDLRSDYSNELTRARLSGTVTEKRIGQLFPPYPTQQHAPVLSQRDWQPTGAVASGPGSPRAAASPLPAALTTTAAHAAYRRVDQAMQALPDLLGQGDGVGSNSWVVSGARSSTGKPLLANDPHLGVSIPGIWYQTALHCRTVSDACPFDVTGFSFAGLPGVVIGHNARIAWGLTNLAPDVTDFYLEQVVGDSVLVDGALVPLTTRQETVKVAGAADVPITVRSTKHGPLLSDVVREVQQAGENAPVEGRNESGEYAVSLAWTGLVPAQTADAIFALDTAANFTEFRQAARKFAAPAQNLVYADVDGHIGYQAPGMIPVRVSADPDAPPGYWPAPGWKSEYDWSGYVPFEQLPYAYDPAGGVIVAANQPVTAGRRPFLTTEWDYGYRAQRIRTLLAESPKVTPERMAQIQLDTRNEFAPTLVKLLLKVNLKGDPFIREAQDLLRGWDYTQPTGQSKSAAAAAYFNAVWKNLLDLTFNDELPAGLDADGGGRWMQAVTRLVATPNDPWWDNKLTANVTEDMTEVLRQSMVNARLDLTRELGKNPGIWQWGRLHALTLRNAAVGGDAAPGLISMLFNRGPVQLPGGSSIVNANGWDAAKGYQVDWAPTMRMVVDLGDLDRSRWVTMTGTSGHPYAEHYDDQVGAWAAGQTFAWPFTLQAVQAAKRDELTLVPGRQPG